MNSHLAQKRRFLQVPANALRDYIASGVGAPLLRQLPWQQGTILCESSDRPVSASSTHS